MSIRQHTLEQLHTLAEPTYRDFAATLIPQGMPLLGVRLPALRRIARELAKDTEAWRHYIASTTTPYWMEETMLLGMLPGYIRGISLAERLDLLEHFIPLISNWSICDSCCSTYRFIRSHRREIQPWLTRYIRSTQEFEARFGIVCLLLHYLPDQDWAPWVAAILPSLRSSAYYATMAAAWCCCELRLRYPDLASPLLADDSPLPPDIRRLAQRKLRESKRTLPPLPSSNRAN